MELQEALTQITEIRLQMARTEMFRGYRAVPAAFSGALALAGAAIQALMIVEPMQHYGAYLSLWIGSAVVSGASAVMEMVIRARHARSPFTRELTAMAMEQFMSVPLRQRAYQPCGDLRLAFAGHEGATEYRRELDIDSAVARVSYRVDGVRYERTVVASRPDNAIVVRIKADRPGAVGFAVKMDSPHKSARTTAAERFPPRAAHPARGSPVRAFGEHKPASSRHVRLWTLCSCR